MPVKAEVDQLLLAAACVGTLILFPQFEQTITIQSVQFAGRANPTHDAFNELQHQLYNYLTVTSDGRCQL